MQMSVYSRLICKWLNRSSANPEAISNMLAQRTGCMGYPGFIGGRTGYPNVSRVPETQTTGQHLYRKTLCTEDTRVTPDVSGKGKSFKCRAGV